MNTRAVLSTAAAAAAAAGCLYGDYCGRNRLRAFFSWTEQPSTRTKWLHVLGKSTEDEQYNNKKFQQFANSTLAPGLSLCSYPANMPVEDRACAAKVFVEIDEHVILEEQLEQLDIYCVFDGHGGYQVADYASETLVPYLAGALRDSHPASAADPAYVNLNVEPGVRFTSALMESFRRVERELVGALRPAFDMGFGNVARVGACALVAVCKGDDVWVANAGDCVAVLGSRCTADVDGTGTGIGIGAGIETKTTAQRLSVEHNARHWEEQERLHEMHPDEMVAGLVRCKSSSSCYVKGHLQPSRSLGDAYLKYQEFRPGLDQNSALQPYTHRDPARSRRVRAPFSPPYVLSDPEIQHITLTEDDDFLILASDGLWDEMTPKQAVEYCYAWRERNGGTIMLATSSGSADSKMLRASSDAPSETLPVGSGMVTKTNGISASSYLVQKALEHAANQSGQSVRDIQLIPPGKRRHIHDDITVVVVELKKRQSAE